MEMRPLEEDLDTFPRVATAGGRQLVNAGGVFPDLAVEDDTLTLAERDLLRIAGEKEVALGLRLAEYAFETARTLQAQSAAPSLDREGFETFIAGLVSEGIPASALQAPGVRDYLHWRARMSVAQRMNEIGREADFRMERDPVLTEAVRLLSSATSQADLFRLVDEEINHLGDGGGP
jgi:hypothetical protein